MDTFDYAKNGSAVKYNKLSEDYVKQAEKDCVPSSTVQHNEMMAQHQSRRNKMKNYNCINMERVKDVRDRLRNKFKYAKEIKLRKEEKAKEADSCFSERDKPSEWVRGSKCSSHHRSTTP